jgi:hypothetical protein
MTSSEIEPATFQLVNIVPGPTTLQRAPSITIYVFIKPPDDDLATSKYVVR